MFWHSDRNGVGTLTYFFCLGLVSFWNSPFEKAEWKKRIFLLIIFIAIIAVIITIVVNSNKNKTKEEDNNQSNPLYDLPDTSYSNMEVKYVQMEYLKDNDETMVSFQIDNTTNLKVTNEMMNVLFINDNGEVLGTMQTQIDELDPGDQTNVSLIYKGDITATTVIKLEKE